MSQEFPSLEHVVALSDDTGIIQHATLSMPNRSTGYCTDDVARALIVVLMRARLDPGDEHIERLTTAYLAFLHDAQLVDGRFHNFMSYSREWLDDVGTHDSCGRAIWGLGYAMRYAPTQQWRASATLLFDRAVACVDWLEYPRAQAYALLGLGHAHAAQPRPHYHAAIEKLAHASLMRLAQTATPQWYWFEDIMTYDNARLPEALIVAGSLLGDERMTAMGLRALHFLETVVFEGGTFVPIGNDGWFPRDGARARFAQQPLEAAAMVDAELAAIAVDTGGGHNGLADLAYAWYYGKNALGVTMASGGGCYDGLELDGANANMGAESTLAFLAAAYAMALRQKQAASSR